MESRESLQILHNELLRRGLPRDYVERVTGELTDHADDLAAEAARPSAMRLTAQLGDPIVLADRIFCEFQRRTFLGRHPWLTFVTLPAGAMLAAWFVTMLSIVLFVELLLPTEGERLSDAGCWAAAVVVGALAYGMTYGMPVLLCWWALRKARQTARPWSWTWAATTVLVLTSFIFRIYLFRTDDGHFGIDSSGALRLAVSYIIYGETVPPGMTLWWFLRYGSFSIGYFAQVVVLIGITAFTTPRFRRAGATMVTSASSDRAETA